MENVRTTKRIFIENWIEELKPVVIINKRGRVWKSKFFKEEVSYRIFVLTGLRCNEQNQGLSAPSASTNVFHTEFMMEEFKHVVAEQYKFEKGAI